MIVDRSKNRHQQTPCSCLLLLGPKTSSSLLTTIARPLTRQRPRLLRSRISSARCSTARRPCLGRSTRLGRTQRKLSSPMKSRPRLTSPPLFSFQVHVSNKVRLWAPAWAYFFFGLDIWASLSNSYFIIVILFHFYLCRTYFTNLLNVIDVYFVFCLRFYSNNGLDR